MTRTLAALLATAMIAAPVAASAEIQLGTERAKIEGNAVTGVSAVLDRPGYVVLHDDCAGKAPNNLGFVAITADKREDNLRLESASPIDPSCNPTVMLHYETNGNTSYDFGPNSTDVDTPVPSATGAMMSAVPKS